MNNQTKKFNIEYWIGKSKIETIDYNKTIKEASIIKNIKKKLSQYQLGKIKIR